jgi:two-component system, LytTR family, sensor kinase
MSRRVVWLQLLIGWLPLWALFTLLILSAHRVPVHSAALLGLRMIACAALLALAVQRLAEHYPWPRQVRVLFVIAHLGYAFTYSTAFILLNSLVESVLRGAVVITSGPSMAAFFLTGVWLYVMVAGVSYTLLATDAAARAEGNAVKAQLAALRAQLHPHFLFNALHSVVQLIPREPKRAADAAERLAHLLRSTIEEDRDLVALEEELDFVERYLALERMRFGDRLQISTDISDDTRRCDVPVFAVQTLIENAVRHAAAPRVAPTHITVTSRLRGGRLQIDVRDDGDGPGVETSTGGTGLQRLRERLAALYRGEGQLSTARGEPRGFVATLVVPCAADNT